MSNQYDTIKRLTSSETLNDTERRRMLNDFAYELGWQPSDVLDDFTSTRDLATAHLMVEHGLENSAIISFISNGKRYSDLTREEKNHLLTISYNNLVDWHIQVQVDGVTFVFNRTRKPTEEFFSISRDNHEKLRKDTFDQIVGRQPNPNVPALDTALVDTISTWKRNLDAEMRYLGVPVSNESLSALFNAVMFIRAIEDNQDRITGQSPRTLLNLWDTSDLRLSEVLLQTLYSFIPANLPDYLVDQEQLLHFDVLSRSTTRSLLSDFYRNSKVPYVYDFSVMSKHALSRIYEHYVSILRIEETPQLTLPFLAPLAEEETNKRYGSIYTPHFIARFFAKYLQAQIPPINFKHIRTIDPACGSGIFLRTLLELQCDPISNGMTTDDIREAFHNTVGMDIDGNACQATRLSLSLLYLALTNQLPRDLNISREETISFIDQHPEEQETFDVVITNPPFISWDNLDAEMRTQVTEFLGDYAQGRTDIYLAFILASLKLLRSGGFGLFVLPHNFLLGANAQLMRKLLSKEAWIRCLVDLSNIPVFGDSGIYPVLLIFQKRLGQNELEPPATIVKVQEAVGWALQDVIVGRRTEESSFYSIYDVEQDTFAKDKWSIMLPTEVSISKKFASLPRVDDFLEVHQGFVTGANDVFIVDKNRIPEGEELIFAPYLTDREMGLYVVPDEVKRYVFYPYIGDEKLNEATLRSKFPQTWKYLLSHKTKLSSRKTAKVWWEPVRSRPPERMLRPKIVTPHLTLTPHFSLDRLGKYAISRSTLLYPKTQGTENDLLRYFLAILNSTPCFWHISQHSHKQRGGYRMLEVGTLKHTPVPDPTTVDPITLRHLLELVDRRLHTDNFEAVELERQIDEIVANLYGLTAKERHDLGLEN